MKKIKYRPKKITEKNNVLPNLKNYELNNEERILLNQIRLTQFLSPDGSNKEYFKKITSKVIDSLLNFYLSGDNPKLKEIIEKDQETRKDEYFEKTEYLANLRFDDISTVKNTIDGILTPEEGNGIISSIPKKTQRLEEVLIELDEITNPSIRFNQRFMGEMHPHDSIVALQASYISKFLNHNVVAQKVSPTITYLEKTVIEWLRESVGYSPQDKNAKYLGGNIISGGTLANLTAMVVARNKKLTYKETNKETGEKEEVSPMTLGLSEIRTYLEKEKYKSAAIFISERSHYSLKEKLANVTGIGINNIIEIATDSEGRINPEDLEKKIELAKKEKRKPIAIMATAGTTEEGMIDPLRKIGLIAKKHDIYYHVDAAHGGGFLISDLAKTSDLIKNKFDGIELADSVTVDGHKMLYTLYPCGSIIFKDSEDAKKYIKQGATYLWKESINKNKEVNDHINSGNQTIEGSRGTDGILQLYTCIKSLGKEGYEVIHKHVINLAKYLHDLIESSNEFKAKNNPDLNIVLYRYEPAGFSERIKQIRGGLDPKKLLDKINERIPMEIYEDGSFYVGETKIKGVLYLRAVIMHPYTETSTINKYLNFVNGVAHSVEEEVLREYMQENKGETNDL